MNEKPHEGRCTCDKVRYRLTTTMLFVHCCHCTWCQRESGSAFVMNGLIEAQAVELVAGAVVTIDTPSASGKGQRISRCPDCHVALWSCYGDLHDRIRFIRIGTLDDPNACPPDIHIFTSSKQPWVSLGDATPTVAEYYEKAAHWSRSSIERYERATTG